MLSLAVCFILLQSAPKNLNHDSVLNTWKQKSSVLRLPKKCCSIYLFPVNVCICLILPSLFYR